LNQKPFRLKHTMKTQDLLALERTARANEAKPPAGGNRDTRWAVAGKRTILLITEDKRLHESLRGLANSIGQIVVRLSEATGVPSILRAVKPTAVLLDLDLPKQAAWDLAEALLSQSNCPSVILFTAPTDQFDLKTAIRAGLLIDKSEGPSRLLEVTEETLVMPDSARTERNVLQRVLIRWLKPRNWVLRRSPANRVRSE
jgi:FixJ family two-component response regulator